MRGVASGGEYRRFPAAFFHRLSGGQNEGGGVGDRLSPARGNEFLFKRCLTLSVGAGAREVVTGFRERRRNFRGPRVQRELRLEGFKRFSVRGGFFRLRFLQCSRGVAVFGGQGA